MGSYAGDADNFAALYVNAGDQILYYDESGDVAQATASTAMVFRDFSAWYHIVFSVDTSLATAADRTKLYVNGTQVVFSGSAYGQNYSTRINFAGRRMQIGATFYASSLGDYFDGYLAETHFVDGQGLTPSSFGETDTITGVWKPKRYAGTYGTNGFYLPFTDNSALTTSSNVGLGKDFSGNGNYWTTNNISITAGVTYDSMTDVPTLTSPTAANFAVLNPLWKGANITLSAANLNASMSATSDASFSSTITITSGKWYWESVITSPSTDYPYIGVATPNFNYQAVGGSCIRSSATGFFKASNATKWNLSSSSYGSSFVANDVMMIAYDADSGKIYFGKNGTWDASSDPAAGTNPAFTGVNAPVTPAGFVYNCSWIMNFGQRPFAYTPPTGFVALNTYNLPTSTIVKGNTVMDATLYTGTGAALSVTNAAGFKPDFVWIKRRDSTNYHILTDSVRGTNSQLFSNDTLAQESRTDRLTAFNSNGFSLGTYVDVNNSTSPFVGWQWQAGQGTTSSNTSGTITSTVSVNASAGFSIASWTANGSVSTIGHGLGVKPSLVIHKPRTGTYDWAVITDILNGSLQYLYLNSTQAVNNTGWGTSPTSSVTSVYSYPNGTSMISYCFAPIAGYSAFGSYTGNGSTDGPFIYTGFRPKFVMCKVISTSNWWIMFDSTRNPYNAANYELAANLSDAEYTANTSQYTLFDFLSNGFKLRTGSLEGNSSGQTYLYVAFAENPFKNSLAR